MSARGGGSIRIPLAHTRGLLDYPDAIAGMSRGVCMVTASALFDELGEPLEDAPIPYHPDTGCGGHSG